MRYTLTFTVFLLLFFLINCGGGEHSVVRADGLSIRPHRRGNFRGRSKNRFRNPSKLLKGKRGTHSGGKLRGAVGYLAHYIKDNENPDKKHLTGIKQRAVAYLQKEPSEGEIGDSKRRKNILTWTALALGVSILIVSVLIILCRKRR